MRLAPRLLLALGSLAAASTAGIGVYQRGRWQRDVTVRFETDLRATCTRLTSEVERQAESDRRLIAGACQSGELVDRTLVAVEAGELDARRLGLAALVPKEREAFDLDEMILSLDDGQILGADPRALLGEKPRDVDSTSQGDDARPVLRTRGTAAFVSRCKSSRKTGRSVALVGARHVAPLVARLGRTIGVAAELGPRERSSEDSASVTCALADAAGARLPVTVSKSKDTLALDLRRIDENTMMAFAVSTGAAFLLAMLLARSLGKPLADLASEASKVASGDARPIEVRGTGEIADLARAFDTMLVDLEVTRRRLAATTRVAAWREVARRVAHEVKNPLAPIRAAVETLRRLRARNDPAFDEYFDEATRTVLDEVHRIANIVTEFTRFARLPPPRPEVVDPRDLVAHVVSAQKAVSDGVALVAVVKSPPPTVRVDKDQIVQVLTNLVQNALDAVRGREGARVQIVLDGVTSRDLPTKVVFTVSDDGPGVSKEIRARLFEPYATTKSHGTGLGLAIAQRIAIEHDGELALVDPVIGGASFALVLPASGPPPAPEDPA
ncbi:MAG: ATP-binding protein [Polyangiaceae bacterium]